MINSPRDLQAMVDLAGWTLSDYLHYTNLYFLFPTYYMGLRFFF